MKKIILALMMISSFLFSAVPPIIKTQYGYLSNPVLGTPYSISYANFGWSNDGINYPDLGVTQLSGNGGVGTSFEIRYDKYWITWLSNIGGTAVVATYMTLTISKPPQCTASQELINNACVEKCPSGQERIDGTCVNSCNQMLSEFRKPDGTCQDCAPYTNFSSRAFCACDAIGSTYTPQAPIFYTESNGNYSYKYSRPSCDNGVKIKVYSDIQNINPQDFNSTYENGTIKPFDTNSTNKNLDSNATVASPTTNTNNDVVEAIKATNDVSKEIKGEIGKVATDVKAMNEHLAKQGVTFNEVLASIKANGIENAKSNQLLGDVNTGLTQFKNKFGQWVDDTRNDSANEVNAINGTTSAVNNQGKNITDKLDEVIKAIKEDGNGTSPTDNNNTGKEIDLNATNKKLDTLHDDNNKTHSKLDTLHDDANKTNSTLSDIKSLLDFNGSKYTLDNMLPSGGEGWFTSNALKLNFNTSSANCYCQQAEFTVAGRNFLFPSQELLDMIPFGIISNIFMAFIYVLGLKNFLKS